MAESIELVGLTAPLVTRIYRDFRNEANADGAVNITGWTIRLIVKPYLDLPDSRAAFTLDASLVSPASGVYAFQFTTKHTGLAPGTYPGEIRFYPNGPTAVALDAVAVDFTVTEPVDSEV